MSRRAHEPAPDPGRFGTTIVLSLALHVAGFTLAVALPRLMPRGSPGPPVYVVDLVSPPEGGAAGGSPPPPAPPAPPRPKIAPPPRPEKAIKLPARDAKKRAETKKTEPKTKPTPAASPAASAAASAAGTPAAAGPTTEGAAGAVAGSGKPGGPGGSGTGSGDIGAFYLTLLRRRIESAWQKPIYPPNETTRRILTATVRLTLTSSGRVTDLQLVSSSGYEALDRSVLRAVQDGQPFPPFPYQLGAGSRTMDFAFDLTPN